MVTLIKTIDQIKKYVSINKNVDFESIEPYIKQAERKFIKAITGKLIYDDYATTPPTDVIELEVYNLLLEASANLSWFLYLPLAQVQVTDSGIAVASGEHFQHADWRIIRDLRRSLADAGFQAIDEALSIMESNTEKHQIFYDWTITDAYTVFNEVFVTNTPIFQKWFNISNSRITFLALKPFLLESHYQYFTNTLDATTIATIKEAATTETKEILKFLQAAQVNYCVSKIAESGTFDLTSTGIYQKLEEFPGYKTKTLESSQLLKLEQSRLTTAQGYYKKALKIIKNNPNVFPNMNISKPISSAPKNTKSIVSF